MTQSAHVRSGRATLLASTTNVPIAVPRPVCRCHRVPAPAWVESVVPQRPRNLARPREARRNRRCRTRPASARTPRSSDVHPRAGRARRDRAANGHGACTRGVCHEHTGDHPRIAGIATRRRRARHLDHSHVVGRIRDGRRDLQVGDYLRAGAMHHGSRAGVSRRPGVRLVAEIAPPEGLGERKECCPFGTSRSDAHGQNRRHGHNDCCHSAQNPLTHSC